MMDISSRELLEPSAVIVNREPPYHSPHSRDHVDVPRPHLRQDQHLTGPRGQPIRQPARQVRVPFRHSSSSHHRPYHRLQASFGLPRPHQQVQLPYVLHGPQVEHVRLCSMSLEHVTQLMQRLWPACLHVPWHSNKPCSRPRARATVGGWRTCLAPSSSEEELEGEEEDRKGSRHGRVTARRIFSSSACLGSFSWSEHWRWSTARESRPL
mmetsp:Transcript_8415/g.28241  ORF Transcript_8415/g.28241 Transcript_8415/m.28241 type:complete len:210 (-) Transcript_8415:316-945(-)